MSSKPYLIKGGVAVDDRGAVTFCNDFNMADVKRFYMLENHEAGFIRAWHGHVTEAKWITVLSGVAIVAVVKMDRIQGTHMSGWKYDEPQRYIMHANGDVLYVPGGYANGHKNLVAGTRVMHFSNLTMDEAKGDDYRFDWNIYGDVWEAKFR